MSAAFLDLAQQCAPQIAVETLAAIVSVESEFQPFAIRINSGYPLDEQPRSRVEAIETATILIAEGRDIDLGLTGLSSGDLARLGLSIADSFDFCLNLKASASLLDGYYQASVRAGASSRQADIVMLRSWFGRGDATVGEMVGYDTKVIAERERLANHLSEIKIGEGNAIRFAGPDKAPEAIAASAGSRKSDRHPEQAPAAAASTWDVFNAPRRSTVLVFPIEQQE